MNENRTAIPTQTWLCLFVTGEKQTDESADYADYADSDNWKRPSLKEVEILAG